MTFPICLIQWNLVVRAAVNLEVNKYTRARCLEIYSNSLGEQDTDPYRNEPFTILYYYGLLIPSCLTNIFYKQDKIKGFKPYVCIRAFSTCSRSCCSKNTISLTRLQFIAKPMRL